MSRFIMRLTTCLMAFSALLGCAPAQPGPPFDGKRAFELLSKQVGLGPRYPGSPGHSEAQRFILNQLKLYADGTRTDEFTSRIGGKTLEMANVVGWFNPDARKWVLLAAHWDTRPTADCEVTAEKRAKPIPGANDGASGVAVLLELARVFHERRPQVGVLMVFFDGEDYGPGESAMYLGAKHFASDIKTSAAVADRPVKIDYGILLDMVGDKNLGIYRERHSVDAAPDVVEKVWSAAKSLGCADKFRPEVRYTIEDDHVPLIRAGVRCIDVIDFDYGPWHTLDDTPDKCSPESLKAVGEVVARVVYDER